MVDEKRLLDYVGGLTGSAEPLHHIDLLLKLVSRRVQRSTVSMALRVRGWGGNNDLV